jgi:hypothetical protein
MLYEFFANLFIYIALAELDGERLPLDFAFAYAMSLPGVSSRAARAMGTVAGLSSWFRPTAGWTANLLGVPRPQGFGGARDSFLMVAADGTLMLAPFSMIFLSSMGVNYQVAVKNLWNLFCP